MITRMDGIGGEVEEELIRGSGSGGTWAALVYMKKDAVYWST